MAFTQSDLDAVERLIASGVAEAEIDGKRVKYADLIKRRSRIRDQLVAAGQIQSPPRASYVQRSRD
jgi:hypothetical protein